MAFRMERFIDSENSLVVVSDGRNNTENEDPNVARRRRFISIPTPVSDAAVVIEESEQSEEPAIDKESSVIQLASPQRYIDTVNGLLQCSDNDEAYTVATQACNTDMATVLQLLTSERSNNHVYDQAWKNAERMLREDNYVSVRGSPPECTTAILAFATQQELHQDFTLKCKEAHTWEGLPYKSLYCLLTRCIHGVKNRPVLHQHVYRGASFHYDKHQFREGATICFKHFLSCTPDPEVARKGGGTVIKFPEDVVAAVGVQDYAKVQEIVVYPWSTFVVDKVEEDMLVLQRTGPFANNVPYTGHLAYLGMSF